MTKTDIQIYIGAAGIALTLYTLYKGKKIASDVSSTLEDTGSSIGLGLFDFKEKVKGVLGIENEENIIKKQAKTTLQQKADALYDELYGPYQKDPLNIYSDADRLKAKREQLKKLGLL